MADEMNRTSIFTVNYLNENGVQQFLDLPAVGMTDAKDKFAKDHPDCQVINIYRKL